MSTAYEFEVAKGKKLAYKQEVNDTKEEIMKHE